MKSSLPITLKLISVFLCLAGILLLQGCVPAGGGGASSPPPKKVEPPLFSSVEEADKKIDFLEKHISDLSDFETQQRSLGVIYDVKDTNTFHAVKLDGKPTYEDLKNHHYGQAAATEKEIVQLKKRLAKAKNAKAEMLSQSKGCFPPDTLVQMEDGTLRPFVTIQPGDKVMTYDIGYNKQVSRPVLELYSVQSNHLYTINGEFKTTGGERLLSQEGWKDVSSLKKGDMVHVNGSMQKILDIGYNRTEQTLHNMQVDDTHNFYVSTADGTSYLVHNTGGEGGGEGGGK